MNASSPSRSGSRRRGFTLVELLVVIGILGLLLAVTVTAFNDLGAGTKNRSAVLQLKSTLSMARQYAITMRQPTYVVFPLTNMISGSTTNLTAYQSYFVVSTRSNVGYQANIVQDLQFLPRQFVFNRTLLKNPGSSNLIASLDASFQMNSEFPGLPGALYAMRCVGFTPSGRMTSGSSEYAEIYLNEGWCDAVSWGEVTNSGIFGIRLYPLTGQVKVNNY